MLIILERSTTEIVVIHRVNAGRVRKNENIALLHWYRNMYIRNDIACCKTANSGILLRRFSRFRARDGKEESLG